MQLDLNRIGLRRARIHCSVSHDAGSIVSCVSVERRFL